ncbi:MAG: substrate-binding domain-containing protein [Phycisphaerae bacterium]|nr:substrate-binding domain-containing protein [Phycisphaerae bacterium]
MSDRPQETSDGQEESKPRQSKVRVATDQLREHILDNLTPGMQLPTEFQLCQLLGVSRNTVRAAIKLLLGDGWLKRERRTRPIVTAPRSRPVRTSGLVVRGRHSYLFHDPFLADLTSTLHLASAAHGRSLLHIYSHRLRIRTPFLSWSPNVRAVDSFLMLNTFEPAIIAEAARLAPTVSLDMECRLPHVSSLFFDQYAAVHMGFKYLCDLGHRRIAFADRSQVTTDPTIRDRRIAYDKLVRLAGLPTDDRWVYVFTTGKPNFCEWFRQFPESERPTAVLANDLYANVIGPLLSGRVMIPEQVSVVAIGAAEYGNHSVGWGAFRQRRAAQAAGASFDDSQHKAILSRFPTVTYLPVEEMATAAIDEVVRRVADPTCEPIHRQFAPELVLGDTTGPPAD